MSTSAFLVKKYRHYSKKRSVDGLSTVVLGESGVTLLLAISILARIIGQ
jgi:hypothetical protein